MKTTVCIVTVFAILVLASVGSAQQYNITGAGARAEGFGGAFIGVADDATAVVWNPAGLSQLQRPEASIVTRYVMEKWENTSLISSSGNWTADQSHFLVNFGSLAIPFRLGGMNLVVAAAYQRQIDLYDTWDQPDDKYTTTGGMDTFTPGIGIQITPTISVGVASNIWFGKSQYNEKYDRLGSLDQQWNYNGTYSGLNFVAGALLDLGGLQRPFPLKVGVSVKTPFDSKRAYSYEYVPPIGSLSTYGTHSTIQMPLMLGFGASYRIGENLTVAADYEMRQFKGKEIHMTYDPPYDYVSPSTTPVSKSGKDLNQVRVGAEYLIVLNMGVFPIRAGYQNVPTLSAYYNADGTYTDQQVIGSGFAVGTGYISERFALDVTYSHSTFDYGRATRWTQNYAKTTISGSVIVYF
jgi:long-subunit fatty acid transport protein